MIKKEIPSPFVVAANGRSGSTFLMKLLNSTEKVGCVWEYLSKIAKNIYEGAPLSDSDVRFYFEDTYKRAMTIPSKIWGMKVDIGQLFIFKRFLDIYGIEPGQIRWIWLSRKNSLLQAVSFFRADKANVWGLNSEDSEEIKKRARVSIDETPSEIFQRAGKIGLADLMWDVFFIENEIVPHHIYYEDFIEESTWEPTVAGIFDFLNVDYALPLEISSTVEKIGIVRDKSYEILIKEAIKERRIPIRLDAKLL